MQDPLSIEEQQILLRLAREAMEFAVRGQALLPLELQTLPPRVRADGASFVTLTIDRELRGCIGTLESYQPLAEDVREHAVAAAMKDPRFPRVGENELSSIKLEISALTVPHPLEYSSSEELLMKLHPYVDGVILKDEFRRATFLPQVWEKIPDPAQFLGHLCQKMGARAGLWREGKLQVLVYQVEEFCEI